jgi:hypothetical protein
MHRRTGGAIQTCDCGREPVTALGNRFDQVPVVGCVAQRLADGEDVVGQVGFLDRGVRPDRLYQLFLGQQAAGIGRQNQKQVEGLGRERDRLAVPQQQPLTRVERDVTELETRFGGLKRHADMMVRRLRRSQGGYPTARRPADALKERAKQRKAEFKRDSRPF